MLSVYNGDTEPSGEGRKEIYVDGTGTSRSIEYDELVAMFPAVNKDTTAKAYYITIDGKRQDVATYEISDPKEGEEAPEEKITITDYTYLLIIKYLGTSALAEQIKTQEFSGAVDTVDNYVYKVDYDLGDIVKVKNEYGIEAEAQIVEILESEDNEDGYVVEPTYEYLS